MGMIYDLIYGPRSSLLTIVDMPTAHHISSDLPLMSGRNRL